MNIRKILNKISAMGMAGLLMVSMTPAVSYAEESSHATVHISVEVDTKGDTSKVDESFTVNLKNDKDEVLESKQVKTGKTTQFTREFTHVGTYNFVIDQEKGDTNGFSYDEGSYEVKIDVVSERGGTLGTSVTVKKNGASSKSEGVIFVNTYNEPSSADENPENPNESETPAESESSSTPESKPKDKTSSSSSSGTPESSSEPTPSSSETPQESSSSTETASTPTSESASTPSSTPTPKPTTKPTTSTPNRRDDNRPRRDDRPQDSYVPVVPELVQEVNNAQELVNLDPDPVPLVSLTTLDDEDVPRAVLNGPVTGDTFNMVLWIALLACSGMVIILLVAKKLKDGKEDSVKR